MDDDTQVDPVYFICTLILTATAAADNKPVLRNYKKPREIYHLYDEVSIIFKRKFTVSLIRRFIIRDDLWSHYIAGY